MATTIYRHRAAFKRNKLSTTIQQALLHEILTPNVSHLDYGCGKGDDVRSLQAKGFNSVGYDPYYAPAHFGIYPADIVTMGYVLNVIECPAERDRTLAHAYSLAKKTLVVSASIGTNPQGESYSDGVITEWGTFERLYGCTEIHEYIETVLGVTARRLEQGIFAVEKSASWQLLISEQSTEELREALGRLEEEKRQIMSNWVPSPAVFLEKYSTNGHTYYRLRSPVPELPGKRKLCKCLHLGEPGSDRYNWGIEALQLRNQLRIINLRINRILQVLDSRSTRTQ